MAENYNNFKREIFNLKSIVKIMYVLKENR